MNHFRRGIVGLLWLIAMFFSVHSCFASPWTVGTKTVLYIRVDFSDNVGEPVSEQEVADAFQGANEFFQDNSNGKTSLQVTVTPVLREPQTLEHYRATDYNEEIINDARAAAKDAGFDTAKFDLDIVAFRRNDGVVGGVGAINGKGLRLFSEKSMRIMVHEMGHNFGLPHAKRWDTTDGTVLGQGSMDEYGNPFDWMGGGGGFMTSHFNARFKNVLGWIPDVDVQTITQSGVYRLNAHDFKDAQGVRALKIPRDGDVSYWIEYRQAITDNPWPMNGVEILQCHNKDNDATLEDMTPGSSSAGRDASLIGGRTFSDWDAGIHITPIDKVETPQHGAIDVLINRGDFSENQPPQLTISASAKTSTIGATTNFTASASDPDGDPLYYYWDFNDGGFSGGSASAREKWQGVGDYVVRCTVSDGKGGTASASLAVRVNFALTNIKMPPIFRVQGRVTCGGGPVQDVLVQVGSQRALTDSDGTYIMGNLPAGRYPVTASKLGYALNSTAPTTILVGSDTKGVDFTASALEKEKPHIRISPPATPQFTELEGTCWDNGNGSGIARVEVFIRCGNVYWNGAVWAETRTPLLATLEGKKWRYATNVSRTALPPGNYYISAVATDRAGNSAEINTIV